MSIEPKQYTIAEFEQFIERPENDNRRFELINGEIVEKVPTEEHSVIAGNIYVALRNYVKPRKLGRVTFEVRRRVDDDTRNVRLPDVDFTSASRIAERESMVRRGAVPQMPDLAVEILSPGQSKKVLREKASYYLANGTRLVWLVFPSARQVEVITADSQHILDYDGTLTGGDVLPGFSMSVEDVFEED